MPRIPGIRHFLRPASGRSTVDADIDDELAFHLDATTERLVASGMTRDAARREALRRFGDVPLTRAALREIDQSQERRRRWRERFDALRLDVRLAARGLRRSPGLVAAVVLTLALGLGANVTMFGIVDRLLLRPPAHVREPDMVGRMYVTREVTGLGAFTGSVTSYAVFDGMRRRVTGFEALAAVATPERTVGRGEAARLARIGEVSGEYFGVLRPRPVVGRLFGLEEDRAATPVIVLSHAMWQRDFNGAADVAGKPVVLDGRQFTVIGVAPRGFTGGSLAEIAAWIPMGAAGYEETIRDEWRTVFNSSWLQVIGRRRADVSVERAGAELTTAYRNVQPPEREAHRKADAVLGALVQERGPPGNATGRVAVWLAGVAAIVLLIACANVANLLLARTLRREREVAVQLALGAGGGRLARQLFIECTLLVLAGTVAALVVALGGARLIATLLLPTVAWDSGIVDLRSLAVTAAIAGVVTLLIGLSPALQARGTAVLAALRGGGRGSTARSSRVRTTLTVMQAALSVMLLVGAGLFVRSLRHARDLDLGFDADRVLVAVVELERLGYDEARVRRFWDTAQERIGALPGVERASLAVTAPFMASWNNTITVPGRDTLPELHDEVPYLNPVTPEFLQTMGTRVVRGRDFLPTDREGAAPVVIINEPMARILWPRGDAVGKCFHIGSDTTPCREIVGIAEEARRGSIRDTESIQYYLPIDQFERTRSMFLFVRARGEDAAALVPVVRRTLLEIDPNITYPDVEPIRALLDPEMRPWRLGATLFTAFGALALLVAAVGLYGVLAYDVAQRTRELGVRSALGARSRDVLWLVLRRGMTVAATGVAVGLVLSLVAVRWIADLLFGVPARDPLTLGVVATVLLLVAAVASVVPAWRATRVSPQAALRME